MKDKIKLTFKQLKDFINESLRKEIKESKPSDYGTYFFHGSRNTEKILKLNQPSPDNILFVTTDIDYANEYVKRQANTDLSNIYIVKLKSNTNIFDAKNKNDFSAFKKYPDEVKEFFNSKTYYDEPRDIFNRFKNLIEYYDSVKRVNFDEEKYYESIISAWNSEIDQNILDRYMQIFAAINYFRKRDPSIFESNKLKNEQMIALRRIFCKDLKEAGYQAFASEEFVRGKWHGRGITSKTVLGIFDENALEYIEPISLDKTTSTKAIRALGKFGKWKDSTGINIQKNYDRSNAHIQRVFHHVPNSGSSSNPKSE